MISKSFITPLILALTSSVIAAPNVPDRQFLLCIVVREGTLLTSDLGFPRQDVPPPLPPTSDQFAAPDSMVVPNRKRFLELPLPPVSEQVIDKRTTRRQRVKQRSNKRDVQLTVKS